MLILPYSTDLRFNKKPYITYIISILCLLIYYAQATNEYEINIALSHYCESVNVVNADKDSLDFIVINVDYCESMLGILHERSEHGAFDVLENNLRNEEDRYYSSDDIATVERYLKQHLDAFRETAPKSMDGVLMHFPDEINPIPMITSSVAHSSWGHVIFNVIFFIAFAPAIEIIINNKLRYLGVLVAISFITAISYSLSVLLSGEPPIPTLGLSGVVMGMIGMSAYLMPKARIKVIFWFIFFIRKYHIPAWILAAWFIGWDTLDMFTSDDYGGINLIAHVSGGFAGYLIGFFWLKQQREDVRDELKEEIELMRAERHSSFLNPGAFNAVYSGGRNELNNKRQQKEFKKNYDNYISELYRLISVHKDSSAIVLILNDYEIQSASVEIYEELFNTIKGWGNSRALLCVGRLVINLLIQRRKYARAIMYVEMCQQVSEEFLLANPDNVLLLASIARENQQYQIAYLLVHNADERYGSYINIEECGLLEIELLWQHLHRQEEARCRMKELLLTVEGRFKAELIKLAIVMK